MDDSAPHGDDSRVYATFRMERWNGDTIVEVGRVRFDVTNQVAAMTRDERDMLRDWDGSADILCDSLHEGENLANPDLDAARDHDGPFEVLIRRALDQWESAHTGG